MSELKVEALRKQLEEDLRIKLGHLIGEPITDELRERAAANLADTLTELLPAGAEIAVQQTGPNRLSASFTIPAELLPASEVDNA